MISFRPDCLYCRGVLRHTRKDHDWACRDFEGVLIRVRAGYRQEDGTVVRDEWHARAATPFDLDLVRRTPDVRLAATTGPALPKTKQRRGA